MFLSPGLDKTTPILHRYYFFEEIYAFFVAILGRKTYLLTFLPTNTPYSLHVTFMKAPESPRFPFYADNGFDDAHKQYLVRQLQDLAAPADANLQAFKFPIDPTTHTHNKQTLLGTLNNEIQTYCDDKEKKPSREGEIDAHAFGLYYKRALLHLSLGNKDTALNDLNTALTNEPVESSKWVTNNFELQHDGKETQTVVPEVPLTTSQKFLTTLGLKKKSEPVRQETQVEVVVFDATRYQELNNNLPIRFPNARYLHGLLCLKSYQETKESNFLSQAHKDFTEVLRREPKHVHTLFLRAKTHYLLNQNTEFQADMQNIDEPSRKKLASELATISKEDLDIFQKAQLKEADPFSRPRSNSATQATQTPAAEPRKGGSHIVTRTSETGSTQQIRLASGGPIKKVSKAKPTSALELFDARNDVPATTSTSHPSSTETSPRKPHSSDKTPVLGNLRRSRNKPGESLTEQRKSGSNLLSAKQTAPGAEESSATTWTNRTRSGSDAANGRTKQKRVGLKVSKSDRDLPIEDEHNPSPESPNNSQKNALSQEEAKNAVGQAWRIKAYPSKKDGKDTQKDLPPK